MVVLGACDLTMRERRLPIGRRLLNHCSCLEPDGFNLPVVSCFSILTDRVGDRVELDLDLGIVIVQAQVDVVG